MTNEVNQRYYPLRDSENSTHVHLIPITEEQYRVLYPEIWRIRKREQIAGRCKCPRTYLWKCDGQCDLCEYHHPDTVSIDEPLPDGEGDMYDCIPDDKEPFTEVFEDRQLLDQLFDRLRELDSDAETIIRLWKDNLGDISDRAIARELGRPQKTFSDQMKRYRTDLRRITGE